MSGIRHATAAADAFDLISDRRHTETMHFAGTLENDS